MALIGKRGFVYELKKKLSQDLYSTQLHGVAIKLIDRSEDPDSVAENISKLYELKMHPFVKKALGLPLDLLLSEGKVIGYTVKKPYEAMPLVSLINNGCYEVITREFREKIFDDLKMISRKAAEHGIDLSEISVNDIVLDRFFNVYISTTSVEKFVFMSEEMTISAERHAFDLRTTVIDYLEKTELKSI